MLNRRKRIAIIGAGVSGIGSIAALKEEGHEPVCFEATDKYGGTWCYREESVVGYSSLMSTTVAINSKEMLTASNFTPRKECSNYPHHREFMQAIRDYCTQKDCERHIQFNTEVIHAKKTADYDQTGRFAVTVKDTQSGKISTDEYDGVVVATGHFNYPRNVIYPGQEKFKGTIMHTHSLKRVGMFKGKNVLIIGSGVSGLDAVEFSTSVAKQVYISTRSGAFVLSRAGPSGFPLDYILLRRYMTWLLDFLPINFVSRYLETFYMDVKFDHRFYPITPKYHVLSKDPVVNDAFGSKLLSGTVKQKGDVKYFTEDGVVFEEDDDVTQIDAVIMATGYDYKFPYLEEDILQVENGRINLYKCMYPPHLPHPTLAFVGFIFPFGPAVPISEMQSRWAAQIFSGKVRLPSKEKMIEYIIKVHEENERRYAPSDIMSLRTDFVQYMDDLASDIGCKPNILKCLLTDFPLYLKLVFGPVLPYQYRLEGPHKWEGARDAIMTCSERVHWPLTREEPPTKGIIQLLFEFFGNIIPRNTFNM